MNNKQIIKSLKKAGLNRIASWAIYEDVSDKSIKDGKVAKADVGFNVSDEYLIEHMNLDAIFMGLNASERNVPTGDWQNFHDTRSMTQDYKIPYMIKGTPLYGSYMTDVLKNFPKTSSKEALQWAGQKDNHEWYRSCVEQLQQEIDLIKPKKIVCFGGSVKTQLDRMVKKEGLNIDPQTKIIQIYHYAAYKKIEDFKNQIEKLK